VNKRIIDLNFPKTAFIVMIKRNNEYIRPGGSTLVQVHDTLMILADKNEEFLKIENCLHKPILPRQEK
jgi:cell volume regulation protein A